MKKNYVIEILEKELKAHELPTYCFIEGLSSRQIDLLCGSEYSYVRNYIKWLLSNDIPIVSIANFIRVYENVFELSLTRICNNARSRFYQKLVNDFLVDLTFEEYRWLCANIKHSI